MPESQAFLRSSVKQELTSNALLLPTELRSTDLRVCTLKKQSRRSSS